MKYNMQCKYLLHIFYKFSADSYYDLQIFLFFFEDIKISSVFNVLVNSFLRRAPISFMDSKSYLAVLIFLLEVVTPERIGVTSFKQIIKRAGALLVCYR